MHACVCPFYFDIFDLLIFFYFSYFDILILGSFCFGGFVAVIVFPEEVLRKRGRERENMKLGR